MPREITSHKVNGLNEAIELQVLDEPGAGGACHNYEISHPVTFEGGGQNRQHVLVKFQNGPIAEVGVNGVSQEVLLAIVEDRLVSFQAGPYACRENAIALTKIQEAILWLQKRTRDRMARGVEGTSIK